MLALALHPICWIFSFLALAINCYYWIKVKEHFVYGNVTPGVIVSLDPMLIAVLTNLSKGVGDYHVIKIIEQRFSTVMEKPPFVGATFPAVALYQQSEDESLPYWEDFDPRPIEFATADQSAIKNILSRMEKTDWKELKLGLRGVPRPFKPGLYHVQEFVNL